jgi:hypothetical protein
MRHAPSLAALFIACAAAPALAQSDVQPGFDTRLLLLAPAEDKAETCFLRRYDSAHLKARPKQRIEAIGLCVQVGRQQPEEKSEPVRYVYNFDFAAKLKDRAGILKTAGECGYSHLPPEEQKRIASKPIWCGVDCDGGGITIEPRKEGAELLARLQRIRVESECGGGDEEKAIDLEGGADDKVFIIPRTTVDDYRAFAGK